MREIEFRGKAINRNWTELYRTNYENGDWVYGYYVNQENKHLIFEKENTWHYYIDENTLCQYTGLKDKNGTKIYEGDILTNNCCNRECDYHIQGYVSFRNGSYVVIKYEEDNGYHIDKEWEVIGNIYDNPELLEG